VASCHLEKGLRFGRKNQQYMLQQHIRIRWEGIERNSEEMVITDKDDSCFSTACFSLCLFKDNGRIFCLK
jgi:hypothetical protein